MNIPAESNLLSIAENIKHQTAALIQQLKSNSFTEPSLDAGCTTELWTTDRLELIASKNSIVALNKELIRLIGGPKSVLWDVGIHYDFAALNVILEFDVLKIFPSMGKYTYLNWPNNPVLMKTSFSGYYDCYPVNKSSKK